MNIFTIFLLGLILLIGAIALNILAHIVHLPNWYTFLEHPKNTSVIGYIWLFLIYPFCLGLIAFFGNKWLL